jgi:hypothetical protein
MWPEPDTGFHGQSGTTSRVAADKCAPESPQTPRRSARPYSRGNCRKIAEARGKRAQAAAARQARQAEDLARQAREAVRACG